MHPNPFITLLSAPCPYCSVVIVLTIHVDEYNMSNKWENSEACLFCRKRSSYFRYAHKIKIKHKAGC